MMHRPSHWMLALIVFVATWAFATDRLVREVGTTLPTSPPTTSPPKPVVVHLDRGAGHAAATEFVLAGRVIDELGWPVPAASVRMLPSGKKLLCDVAGAFRMTVLGPGPYTLEVAKPTFETTTTSTPTPGGIMVVLAKALPWEAGLGTSDSRQAKPSSSSGARLAGEGVVLDRDGEAVPGAVITVAGTGTRVVADGFGRYRVPLPHRDVVLIGHRDRLVGRKQVATDPRREGLRPLPDLVLERGATLRGFLKDVQGNPCAGAGLRLAGGGLSLQATTDESGGFALSGLIQGGYELSALPWHGSLGLRRHVDVQGSDVDLELSLRPEQPLTVQVVDRQSRPQARLWVLAEEADLRRAHGRTDARGRATLRGLGKGPFQWAVRAPGTWQAYEVTEVAREPWRLTVRKP